MQKFLRKNRYPLIIFLISIIVFFANLKAGTYLMGWDSLQTELNPSLAVKRAFFAVWEEYQSFGLVSGMAHASDLPRAIFLWLISFILPQQIVRYFFHSLMLFVGGLGAFILFRDHFRFTKEKIYLAFLGALFYMFNLGTIQLFYVPFEPFSVFFAALPWEIWIFLKTLEIPSKKNLLLFVLINLLAIPQSYLQTLFVVYGLILGCLTMGKLIEDKSFVVLKRAVLLILLTLAINAFWLLPQLYFLQTQGTVITESKINQLATGDIFYQNFEKGTVNYFLQFKGFYFDLFRSNQQALFSEWQKWFSLPIIGLLPYLFGGLIIIGLFSKRKNHLGVIFVFALCALFLLSATPPFSWLNYLIRRLHFIDQVFRSPFTKFIIPTALVASYFFINTLSFLEKSVKKPAKKKLLLILITILLFIYCLPVFEGLFFSPSVKIKLPQKYLSLINYFNHQDKNARIALFPDYTFWGWFFNRWGYNGSGYLWYGIEQPIISRTFDVWSDKSEGYFWEIKSAAEAEDIGAFENTLEKYDVNYLVVDYSLLPISSTLKGLQYDRLNAILTKSQRIKLVKKYNNLAIYRFRHEKKVANFISVSTKLPNIGPAVKVTNNDVTYQNNRDYQTSSSFSFSEYFPFLDFTTQTRLTDKRWRIEEDKNNFVVSTDLDLDTQNYDLVIPETSQEAFLYIDQAPKKFVNQIETRIDGKKLSVTIPKTLIQTVDLSKTKIANCEPKKGNLSTSIRGTNIVSKASGGALGCFGYFLPHLEQRYGYLIKIKNTNLGGRRFFFYLLDQTKKQSYLEDRLINNTEHYLISPKYQYGLGYSLNFQNNSYQNLTSINSLSELSVYLFPTQQLQSIYLKLKNSSSPPGKFVDNFQAKKINYFKYEVKLSNNPSQLILWQAYNPGWKAYQNGKESKTHVLVNNWANGWKLEGKGKVDVVFWPQYLEYVGFGLLIISFIVIVLQRRKLL